MSNFLSMKLVKCKDCNIKRGVKSYYDKKDEISIQQKIYYEKDTDKLLQKQNDHRNKRNTEFKELLKSYVELQNKFKALEEKSHTQQVEN